MRAKPLSRARFSVTPWTGACQAPLSMGFSRQEYWSGLPFPPPGDLPAPGVEPESLMSPARAGSYFTPVPPNSEAHTYICVCVYIEIHSFSDSFPF